MSQLILTKEDVLLNFEYNIDSYCEQIASSLPESRKREVCTIVTQELSDRLSESHIRKHIKDVYKTSYRQRNGRLKGLRQKLKNFESGILDTTVESISYTKRKN